MGYTLIWILSTRDTYHITHSFAALTRSWYDMCHSLIKTISKCNPCNNLLILSGLVYHTEFRCLRKSTDTGMWIIYTFMSYLVSTLEAHWIVKQQQIVLTSGIQTGYQLHLNILGIITVRYPILFMASMSAIIHTNWMMILASSTYEQTFVR